TAPVPRPVSHFPRPLLARRGGRPAAPRSRALGEPPLRRYVRGTVRAPSPRIPFKKLSRAPAIHLQTANTPEAGCHSGGGTPPSGNTAAVSHVTQQQRLSRKDACVQPGLMEYLPVLRHGTFRLRI